MTNVTHDQCDTWPTWHMTNVTHDQSDTWPMWHMTNVTHDQRDTWPTWHMTNVTRDQRDTWPMWHMTNVTHDQCDTWPTWHMTNVTHDQRDTWCDTVRYTWHTPLEPCRCAVSLSKSHLRFSDINIPTKGPDVFDLQSKFAYSLWTGFSSKAAGRDCGCD